MSEGNGVASLTPGVLANNGMVIQGLQKLLTGQETNIEVLVRTIKDVVSANTWRAFMRNEQVFKWGPADFRKFIEAERPAGCQTPLHTLEHLLDGTDAWDTYLALTRGKPGSPLGGNNPEGLGGKSGKVKEGIDNRDNITVNNNRDYSREAPTGTSKSYAARVLSTKRPDLYERVNLKEGDPGKLSYNAAMIEAGFREEQLTIPLDPVKAARRLVKHFTREQFDALVDEALSHYRK